MTLSEMPLSGLLYPYAHACSCGKTHRCGLKICRVEKGALRALPETLRTLHIARPFIVMDENTREAAGRQVLSLLEEGTYRVYCFPTRAPIEPDERPAGRLLMRFDPACDGVIAVGSGVLNDLCKVLCHAVKVPQITIATAPSMDGYASNSSSMVVSGVKTTLYNACPDAILADTDILATAPEEALKAGLGDMLAKFISVSEWRISALVTGEPYCAEIADLMRQSARRIAAQARALFRREEKALREVTEGLILSGLAMAFAESSRPASGLEHYFSHVWDMRALQKGAPAHPHGIQVGVGTLLTLQLSERFLQAETVDRDKARAAFEAFDGTQWQTDVCAFFGDAAPEILALEEKTGKNRRETWEKRLGKIEENWEALRAILREELPAYREIYALMRETGLPLSPEDLGLFREEAVSALRFSRDLRDKYLTSSLLWDLGMMEDAMEFLREEAL